MFLTPPAAVLLPYLWPPMWAVLHYAASLAYAGRRHLIVLGIWTAVYWFLSRPSRPRARRKGQPAVAGYMNQFIHLEFPELAGTTENKDGKQVANCWVKIRNPRLMSGAELSAFVKIERDENGNPDSAAAMESSFAMAERLIVAARVWDPTWAPEFDDAGDPIGEPPLLPHPLTSDSVRKMPMEIFQRIGEEVKNSTSPRLSPEATGTRT